MKITVLMENNTDKEYLIAEHGLSLYIETENHKILFDTGQSDGFYQNAMALGIDLTAVDIAILSHGHYDHGGGLHQFLEINNKAKLYINQHAFGDYYSGMDKYIGLDKDVQDNEQVMITEDYLEIEKGLELFSCNQKEKLQPINKNGLFMMEDGIKVLDTFLHEQYFLITEDQKQVLISGCSHKGIVNIVDWFEPDVLIGGFHFSKYNPEGLDVQILDKAIEKLSEYKTQYYTCHCTGIMQYEYMKKEMKEQLKYISAGSKVVI